MFDFWLCGVRILHSALLLYHYCSSSNKQVYLKRCIVHSSHIRFAICCKHTRCFILILYPNIKLNIGTSLPLNFSEILPQIQPFQYWLSSFWRELWILHSQLHPSSLCGIERNWKVKINCVKWEKWKWKTKKENKRRKQLVAVGSSSYGQKHWVAKSVILATSCVVARNLPIWSGNNRCHTCHLPNWTICPTNENRYFCPSSSRRPSWFFAHFISVTFFTLCCIWKILQSLEAFWVLVPANSTLCLPQLQLKWNTNSKLLSSKLACWTLAACVLIANNSSSFEHLRYLSCKTYLSVAQSIFPFPRRDILPVVAKPMHKSFSYMHSFNQFQVFLVYAQF